ncbi:OsmC family protein [Tautonia sp. JC769]|uniref:OsmC family protein n=1 Tax=Tautonia sp. JC769 TaxID=3232135 RepID=UPI003458E67B
MDGEQLRALQAPLKAAYRDHPETARLRLSARGTLAGDGLTCRIEGSGGIVEAGLHPATGGDGSATCSGAMLLEALVACAGVTLRAVATAMGIPLRGGSVIAEGDWDARGTLGVDKSAPVGFPRVRLRFEVDSDATDEQLAKLLSLTERYCVVAQTLKNPPEFASEIVPNRPADG